MSSGPKKQLPVLDVPVGSLNSDGSRNFVHPADVRGRFQRVRWVVFAALMVVYVALPFIRIGGEPAVFLDIVRRRFYLFGATFNAQDFWMVFLLLFGILLALVIVTTLWGRIWCGYACPQTVFLEGIYRQVERRIEGPRNVRLRRNAGPWRWDKVWRKVLKHGLFLFASFLIAHVFLSYFVSLPSLWTMMGGSPADHPVAFAWSMGMTLVLYLNFAWFREQLCLIVCPYGRLQSALTDEDTMVIGYDVGRGEPRGKIKKQQTGERGDCIDCHRCVVVCPTGIDIRNGLQMECIGCAACVDACDEIMEKVDRPKGLIRYDSQRGLRGDEKRSTRGRLVLYGIAVLAWAVGMIFAFQTHEPFEANLLRPPGGTPFVVSDGVVQNTLQVHLVNKADESQTYVLEAQGDDVALVLPQPEVTLEPGADRHVVVLARVPEAEMRAGLKARVEVRLEGGSEEERVTLEAPVLGPVAGVGGDQ
ncbi:MAG: cytochrome c oxidase accessory protein CcoG [Deltaproteobacteria bacterium]|nr:cytochrome c oxidase accessory protein CcoG [Deltaproteobacteria bacterium]